MSQGVKARYGGRWYDEENSGNWLAFVNACVFGQISGKGKDEAPAVRADPIAANIAVCPEDPRDGLSLNEAERELLR